MVMGYEQTSAERKQLQVTGEIPEWFTTLGYQLFKKKYAYNNETVKGAFHRVASTLAKHYPDQQLAYSKFFELLWSGKLAPSTPVLCNTGTTRGMPVSCSGGYTPDSISGFYQGYSEVALLSKNGFGTSSYLGDIRPSGSPISTTEGVADGPIPVLDSYLDVVRKVSQGSNRRGAFAGYIEFSSKDFEEVLAYVQKNPADSNLGVCIRDSDIAALTAKESWAIQRFADLLYLRARTGKGYIFKPDAANRLAPVAIKNSGISIKGSNLCCEIALPADDQHTFTCVLSSLNLIHWDSITDEDIRWSIVFLDCVTSEFIEKAKGIPELHKAVRFTEKFRALGLGALGYATMLQEKGLAFEGLEAHMLNNKIFKRIREQANIATAELARLLGEPSCCAGLGVRNATLMAIAPNLSSAILAGSVSQGIEPIVANAFIQQTAGGEFIRYNPTLMSLMKDRVSDIMEELKDIATNHSGSVQHVSWLSDEEKLVFRTAYEIDQHSIIRTASVRQQYIDQGQSINLFFSAEEDERVVAEVHKEALLDQNIKGLYYLRSTRGVKPSSGVCVACEG